LSKSKGKREIRRLRELIRKYKNEGYEIYANYLGFKKPQSIAGVIPDLIVRKGDQKIIIEVISDESLNRLEDKVKRLSEYAERHEGTRFDLVLTNPRPRLPYQERIKSCEYLLGNLQRNLLHEAKQQYSQRNFEFSFLILCIILESLIKELAIRKKIVPIHEKMSISQLVDMLSERGVLSRDDFAFVQKMLDYRNKVIHGLQQIEKECLHEYIDFVSILLKTIR